MHNPKILDNQFGQQCFFQRFVRVMWWHEKCGRATVDITANKIKEWVEIDRRRKIRAESRSQFFGRVRSIFIFLFVATVFVFVFNHRVELQSLAFAKLHAVIKKTADSEKLRQGAVNYEKQVDEITK